jgi:hypothetical protein
MKKVSFKKSAAANQVRYFRGEKIGLAEKTDGRTQPHWLDDQAAAAGKIFYDGYDIFRFVQEVFRQNKKSVPEWFKDTLRSQHIPFNFFVPLRHEYALCIKVFNELLKLDILEIKKIAFEYPKRKDNPLMDNTSFDVFIDYSLPEGKKGFLGIEVKYTEGGYSPGKNEKENYPRYHDFSKGRSYLDPDDLRLESNRYRQVWRNHLLAVSYANDNKYSRFHSVTFYPKGNDHFREVMKEYPEEFLTEAGKKTLKGITYEDFIRALADHAENSRQQDWIKYLRKRYLV